MSIFDQCGRTGMRSIAAGLLAIGLGGAALVAPERAGAAVAAGDQVYVTDSALRAGAKLATVPRFTMSLTGTVRRAGTVRTGHGARGIVRGSWSGRKTVVGVR